MDTWTDSTFASPFSPITRSRQVLGFRSSKVKLKSCVKQSLLGIWRMSACPFHIRGQKTTPNSCDVYVFDHWRSFHWRMKERCVCVYFIYLFIFCFVFHTEQNCRDKQTLPCKVKTQHLRCVLKYWFSLAVIGRGSKEDGAMCAGLRVLGEIQAALCTPREWGLAYIECLCCRIESVEHLCLSSLTVKLGLTKNPSYTNRKWSRFFFSLLFCMKPFHVTVFVKYVCVFLRRGLLNIQLYMYGGAGGW